MLEIELQTIDGETTTLSKLGGKAFLIVNVASKCGFTSQYEGLEALYREYKDSGLIVLGFPCNQFGGQEPGSLSDIKSFCTRTYSVTFPLFDKVQVNGSETHPLYAKLKDAAPGLLNSKPVKWNFTKFLVSHDGSKVERFAPKDSPSSIEKSELFSRLLN